MSFSHKSISNKKLINILFVLLFSIIVVTINFFIFIELQQQKISLNSDKVVTKTKTNVEYPYFDHENIDKEVKEITTKFNQDNIIATHQTYIINQDYANIFFELQKDGKVYHENHLININGESRKLSSILKKDSITKFEETMYEQLSVKYPDFIVEYIKTNEGNISYNIKENEMVIYFENFNIVPNPNRDIFINLNYHEVKDYLNFKYKLDKEYTNPNFVPLDPNKPTIALTYDDGPTPGITEPLLDILDANNVTATFFMLGQRIKSYPEIVKRISEDHEAAAHSWSHKSFVKLNEQQLDEEVIWTNDTYKSITGKDMTLLRPPYGNINERAKTHIKNNSFILWNVDPRDWVNKDSVAIKDHILNHAKDGDIILLHDLYHTSVEATKLVLPELYSRGIQVTSVGELAKLKNIALQPNTLYRNIKQ